MKTPQRILAASLTALLLLAGCGSTGAPSGQETANPALAIGKGHPIREEKPAPAEPETLPDLPTGILVMIDNQTQARPQMGIDKADLVFEIMAEGGITRYMALFYTQKAEVIGPVRSARYYFVQLAKGLDLPYAHVGGAVDALSMIGELRIKDLDDISNAQQYFWQDPARQRPHSTYTSTDMLVEAATKKQFAYKIPDLPPISKEFSGEPLAGGRLTLTYATGRYGYQAQWVWDESLGDDGGQYRRYINGQPQATADGAPLAADTIFVVAARTRTRNTDPLTSSVDIVGSGQALCIVENKIIRGVWEKAAADKPLIIRDDQGRVMARKLGPTWIQVVDSMEDVSFGQ
jgi:hypothetical protein